MWKLGFDWPTPSRNHHKSLSGLLWDLTGFCNGLLKLLPPIGHSGSGDSEDFSPFLQHAPVGLASRRVIHPRPLRGPSSLQWARHLSLSNTRRQWTLLPPASGCFSHDSCKHTRGPVQTVFSGVLNGAWLGTDYADLGANVRIWQSSLLA